MGALGGRAYAEGNQEFKVILATNQIRDKPRGHKLASKNGVGEDWVW